MTELDYAYLADYAVVQEGRLTAVGASFTHVNATALPAMFSLSIAGRIRAPQDVTEAHMTVTIDAPESAYQVRGEIQLTPGEAFRPYGEGKIGILFAATTTIPLPTAGLYVVNLDLEGQHVRRLAFDVSTV